MSGATQGGPSGPLSETQVIELISRAVGPAPAGLKAGIGDDAALIQIEGGLLVATTDLLVEGIHFQLAYATPAQVGHRAMAANLSDLAAMGASPRWGLLNLGLPSGPQADFLSELMGGLLDLGREHGLHLVGGDTTLSPVMSLGLTLLGLASADPPLRGGAQAGDVVCVTGRLGAAAAGLAWLEAGGDQSQSWAQGPLQAHLRPQPRLAAGQALAASGRVHAMMDISDGLASDLARLAAASGLAALVQADQVPIGPNTRRLAQELGARPLDWALTGGEDFELLFTCQPSDLPRLRERVAAAQAGLSVTQVGQMIQGQGVSLEQNGSRHDISFLGYDHFRSKGGLGPP